MLHLLLAVIYLAFVSLGLPDSILGAAWPAIYPDLNVSVSYAGIISMIISGGTIVSSLQSDRLTRALGTEKVTMTSVAMTAFALFGFSISHSFLALCLWAIPYGLGAGSVDASLNNYVALHYASRHMNWLHCMWGVGASLGPYIMGFALTHSKWQTGYRLIAMLQIALTAVLFLSLPLWKEKKADVSLSGAAAKALSLSEVFHLPGAKQAMITFFCYCALESTTGLWAASYLVLHHGVNAETAASFASLFYIGITVGRAGSGFFSMKLHDHQMVRLGQGIVLIGATFLLLPIAKTISLAGLVTVGLGCAPIYPGLLHATPEHFGEELSQAIMGVQMACAYVGTCLMPPFFGILADAVGISLLPAFLLGILVLMISMSENLNRTLARIRKSAIAS